MVMCDDIHHLQSGMNENNTFCICWAAYSDVGWVLTCFQTYEQDFEGQPNNLKMFSVQSEKVSSKKRICFLFKGTLLPPFDEN